MLHKFLIGLRNLIWNFRLKWNNDPFEKPNDFKFDCDMIYYDSLDALEQRLIAVGCEINHLLQYEFKDCVLSCRYIHSEGKRQYHFRFFFDEMNCIQVFGHDEYTPEYAPLKHIRGETLNNSACPWFYQKIYKITIDMKLEFL